MLMLRSCVISDGFTISTLLQRWLKSARGNPFLGKRPIWGDGQAWRVELTSRNESIVQNDGYEAQRFEQSGRGCFRA